MEAFEVIQLIGRGNYGSVHLCKHHATGTLCAVKKIPVAMSPDDRAQTLREVALLSHLSHPCIVQLYDAFVQDGFLHVVMEYCQGGDLGSLVKAARLRKEFFSERQVLDYVAQLALALRFIHGKRVLHRDLKCGNIFLTASNTVRLGDFGIARVLESTFDAAKTVVGTPYYFSPEVCRNAPYDDKSDVWALGCVLYELCSLRHAFSSTNLLALVFKIVQEGHPPLPPSCPPRLAQLVDLLLAKDPGMRPSAEQVLALPFIAERLAALRDGPVPDLAAHAGAVLTLLRAPACGKPGMGPGPGVASSPRQRRWATCALFEAPSQGHGLEVSGQEPGVSTGTMGTTVGMPCPETRCSFSSPPAFFDEEGEFVDEGQEEVQDDDSVGVRAKYDPARDIPWTAFSVFAQPAVPAHVPVPAFDLAAEAPEALPSSTSQPTLWHYSHFRTSSDESQLLAAGGTGTDTGTCAGGASSAFDMSPRLVPPWPAGGLASMATMGVVVNPHFEGRRRASIGHVQAKDGGSGMSILHATVGSASACACECEEEYSALGEGKAVEGDCGLEGKQGSDDDEEEEKEEEEEKGDELEGYSHDEEEEEGGGDDHGRSPLAGPHCSPLSSVGQGPGHAPLNRIIGSGPLSSPVTSTSGSVTTLPTGAAAHLRSIHAKAGRRTLTPLNTGVATSVSHLHVHGAGLPPLWSARGQGNGQGGFSTSQSQSRGSSGGLPSGLSSGGGSSTSPGHPSTGAGRADRAGRLTGRGGFSPVPSAPSAPLLVPTVRDACAGRAIGTVSTPTGGRRQMAVVPASCRSGPASSFASPRFGPNAGPFTSRLMRQVAVLPIVPLPVQTQAGPGHSTTSRGAGAGSSANPAPPPPLSTGQYRADRAAQLAGESPPQSPTVAVRPCPAGLGARVADKPMGIYTPATVAAIRSKHRAALGPRLFDRVYAFLKKRAEDKGLLPRTAGSVGAPTLGHISPAFSPARSRAGLGAGGGSPRDVHSPHGSAQHSRQAVAGGSRRPGVPGLGPQAGRSSSDVLRQAHKGRAGQAKGERALASAGMIRQSTRASAQEGYETSEAAEPAPHVRANDSRHLVSQLRALLGQEHVGHLTAALGVQELLWVEAITLSTLKEQN